MQACLHRCGPVGRDEWYRYQIWTFQVQRAGWTRGEGGGRQGTRLQLQACFSHKWICRRAVGRGGGVAAWRPDGVAWRGARRRRDTTHVRAMGPVRERAVGGWTHRGRPPRPLLLFGTPCPDFPAASRGRPPHSVLRPSPGLPAAASSLQTATSSSLQSRRFQGGAGPGPADAIKAERPGGAGHIWTHRPSLCRLWITLRLLQVRRPVQLTVPAYPWITNKCL